MLVEKSNHYSYLAANLQTNKEWPGKTAPLVQYYHGHHESNINLRMDLSPTIQDENLTPLLGEPPMSRYIIGH